DLDPCFAFGADDQAVRTRGDHFGLFLVLVLRHGLGLLRRHDAGRGHRDGGDRLALFWRHRDWSGGSDRHGCRCYGDLRRDGRRARLGFSFLVSFLLAFPRCRLGDRGPLGLRRLSLLLPFVAHHADQHQHAERESEIHEGRLARAVRERHRLVIARRQAVRVRHLEAAGNPLDQRIGIELEQARVAAHHAAREGRARQRRELLLRERLELARRELELLRHVGEREPARLARRRELLPYPCKSSFSQTGLAEAPGIPETRENGGATGWRTPAPARARPGGARCAARATATRGSVSPPCCGARPACAPRRYCPAGSGSGPGSGATQARRAPGAARARSTTRHPWTAWSSSRRRRPRNTSARASGTEDCGSPAGSTSPIPALDLSGTGTSRSCG